MSFDFEKFADTIENGLKGNCQAYAFVVSYKDNWKVKRAGGMARTIFNIPPLEMSTNVRFHIASVSKAITAVALLKLLYEKKDVGLNSAFHTWLPEHWQVHQSLREITFEQLLTHKSGFRFGGSTQYSALKKNMADGINPSDVGIYSYQGENFTIMSLLIPRLANSPIVQVDMGNSSIDLTQSISYAAFYIDYVQKHLFAKAGLPALGCSAEPLTTGVCYHFPNNNKPGTDFGNTTMVAASKGWVMSAAEMAKFFRTVHYTENILPAWLSEKMRTDSLGYDEKGTTSEGIEFYRKNGGFPGSQNEGELNSLTIGYANHVQVALIINSELANSKGMVGIINDAHDEAYKMIKVSAGGGFKRP